VDRADIDLPQALGGDHLLGRQSGTRCVICPWGHQGGRGAGGSAFLGNAKPGVAPARSPCPSHARRTPAPLLAGPAWWW